MGHAPRQPVIHSTCYKGTHLPSIITRFGEYIHSKGYDPLTQLYLDFGGEEFPPLVTGDQEDAKEIVTSIIDNMFPDFEWENPNIDPVSGVVIFLTTLLRKLMDIAPGFLIKANLQGSGKTTLVRIVHVVVTGHDMAVSTLSEDPQEARKSMLAILMESPSLICFDNIPDGFEVRNEILAKVLSMPVFKDRLLGASKQVDAPTNTVITLTGNNIILDADLSRRILPVGLQPKVLMPEKRSFRHRDIVTWSRSIRVDMIQKALSIVSIYLNAGSPLSHKNLSSSGFPMWDDLVRFPILWATGVDIIEAVDNARLSSNDLVTRNAAISALSNAFPNSMEFSATDVLSLIENPQDSAACQLRDAFIEIGSKTIKSAASIGWALRKLLGYPGQHGSLRKQTENNKNKYFIDLRDS